MSSVDIADGTAVTQWSVWTTEARLVLTDPSAIDSATGVVRRRLEEIDLAASRFRPDSEVSLIAASGRQSHRISPLLADLVLSALAAAEATNGRVDPTLGTVLTHLGYGAAGPGSTMTLSRASKPRWSARRRATWRDVTVDGGTLRLPSGTLLDLGATAKAIAADHCAEEIAEAFGCGVMLSLGGDLRVAGPEPADGWNVLVQDGPTEPASHIRLTGACAVATSSTLHRRWSRNGRQMHHVIDPMTRRPAETVWRTVTVAAPTCLQANTLSTQAIVLGEVAPSVLADAGVAARLVDAGGDATRLGGWPT